MICFVLPTIIPMYFWGETLNNAWHITMLRYVFSLNSIFLVNSAAHLYGYRPYDKNILPVENKMASMLSLGESFHNYHHAFPWDYRASELGNVIKNYKTLKRIRRGSLLGYFHFIDYFNFCFSK